MESSHLHTCFNDGDFLDCYSVDLNRTDIPLMEIAQRIFIDLPGWVNALLAVRDISVSLFNLKTTAELPKNLDHRSTVEVGEHINFLCVRSIAENEIILGEDDQHLDFKISVCRETSSSGRVSLATWVHPHGRLGKTYLRIIRPFHVQIVRSRLRGLARYYEG